MNKIVFLFLLFVFQMPLAFADTASILIKNVAIIDGSGGPKIKPQDIEIIGNKIARIGQNLNSKAHLIIDGAGKTVIPGLIDTHTHLLSVPGSRFRKDSPEEIYRQQLAQKKAYLAVGVTTVLDAASPESLFKEVAEEKNTSPRILGLAPFLTPVGGYFSNEAARGNIYQDLWQPIKDIPTIKENFEQAIQLRPLGAKVTMERGFGPFEVWPTFNKTFRDAIVAEAKKNDLPLFIHSMSKEEHKLALSMNPYTLVHAGFNSRVADSEIIDEIKNSKAYVSSTLAIYKMMLLMWEPETLNDVWLKKLVTSIQLDTALNFETRKKVIETIVLQSKPVFVTAFLARLFSKWFMNKSIIEKQLSNSMKSVKLMSDAKIPLVMGSDAGNWPVWTTFFHGVGSILEIEALWEAGIQPSEIIVASTSRAAKMLKIDNEVGRIAEGVIADLVILNEDPLKHKTAFRNAAYVIKDGIVKAPFDWLK